MKIAWSRRILLILGFSTLLLFALFQGGFLSWFLFAFISPLLLYCIGASFFVDMKKISFQREVVTKNKVANHPLEIKVTIKNENKYPILFLYLEEEISDGLLQTFVYHQPRISFYFLRQKTWEWNYTIDNVTRGKHQFYGLRVRMGDFFGFCSWINNYEIQEEIIVYPEVVPLTIVRGSNYLEDGSIYSNNSVHQHHTVPISVREYQHGDKLSWINWKATAKRNELMTKEFENRKSIDTTIILDVFSSNQLEVAISFVASLMSAFMNGQSNITLQYLQTTNSKTIVSGDLQQLDKIMYDLALLKGENTSDSTKFQQIIKNYSRSQMIYLVLPQLTTQWLHLINEIPEQTNITVFVMKHEYQFISHREKELIAKVKKKNTAFYIKETLFQHHLNQALKNR